MLQIELGTMNGGDTPTMGMIPVDTDLFAGAPVRLAEPLAVAGTIRTSSHGDLIWQVEFQGAMAVQCRRCLRPVCERVDDRVDLVFSRDPELLEDPSVYPLPERSGSLDLVPVIREEVLLRAAKFPLCREACKGLCQRCGADLNAAPCSCSGAESNHRG